MIIKRGSTWNSFVSPETPVDFPVQTNGKMVKLKTYDRYISAGHGVAGSSAVYSAAMGASV